MAAILGTSDFVLGSVDKSTRYDYTNAITIGTIISGVLVTVAALTIDVKPIYS